MSGVSRRYLEEMTTTFGSPTATTHATNSSNGNVGSDDAGSNAFEEYFSATATFSGARKMLSDVSAARRAYESAWEGLGERERAQAVDDAIIAPEAAIKYHRGGEDAARTTQQQQQQQQPHPLPSGVTQVFPRLRQRTGAARRVMVVEDAAGSQGEDLDSASSSGCVSVSFTFFFKKKANLSINILLTTFFHSSSSITASKDFPSCYLPLIKFCPHLFTTAPNNNKKRERGGE